MAKICLVTEELADAGRSGGIGAAFKEIALFLSKNGFSVDIIYCNSSESNGSKIKDAIKFYSLYGINLEILDCSIYVDASKHARAISYAVYQKLRNQKTEYDFIHFHDYKGIGFYCTSSKNQGIFFEKTTLVVQIHGPTRWALEENNAFFTHEDQLIIDFMERKSIEWADKAISPSNYMANWVNNRFFPDSKKDILVIKNLCRNLLNELHEYRSEHSNYSDKNDVKNIVIFARHEERKGIVQACDALDEIGDELRKEKINVIFVGQPGTISGQPSAIYFIERSKNWKFDFEFRFGMSRKDAANFLRTIDNPLVIVPSPNENSPYTVLETLILKLPMIASLSGGGVELVREEDRSKVLCFMDGEGLAMAIRRTLREGSVIAEPAEHVDAVEHAWLEFHQNSVSHSNNKSLSGAEPLVTVGITHYERPKKVIDSLMSIIRQSYKNIEILMVDDGSKSQETINTLVQIETILDRVGGKLIRQKNSYLGAARNAVLNRAKGEYIIFLDDDDIASPNMVEMLVMSAKNSGSDVVTCLNSYMPEENRSAVLGGIETKQKVSYFPLGGPLSISPEQNIFGSATALIRRKKIEEIGGYTEIKGVGHEDYEIYIRLSQAGARFSVCPEPLFFYEVGRPSMISRTSMMRNYRRCFDAIEFGKNIDAWSDYINLCAGRPCAVNTHNRSYYLNSNSPTASLRIPLMQQNITIDDYISGAISLARAENNIKAARAFSVSLHSNAAEYDDMSDDNACIEEIFTGKKKEYIVDDVVFNDINLNIIRTDINLKRVDDAMNKIHDYVKNSFPLSKDIFIILSEISDQVISEHSISVAKNIVVLLSKCRVSRMDDNDIVLLIKFLVKTRSFKEASQAMRALLKKDEDDYKSIHKDVAEIVENGSIGAFDHYVIYGAKEQRIGFERCKKITSAFCNMFPKNISIDIIRDLAINGHEGFNIDAWNSITRSN